MADVNISAFLPDVLVHVDGCPRNAALQELRNAAIRFCENSWYDRRWLAEMTLGSGPASCAIPVIDGQSTYDVMVADGYDLVEIPVLSFPGASRSLIPMTVANMERLLPGWQETVSAIPSHFIVPETGKIDVWPKLDPSISHNGDINGLVVLKPTRIGNHVGERIYKDYYETIVAGALARLLIIPNKPWTNAQLASFYATQFIRGTNDAKVKVLNQFNSAETFINMPTFGAC